MAQKLNPRIIDSLDSNNCEEAVKMFIREMLYFELEHMEEQRPRYTEVYNNAISKYVHKFRGEQKDAI